MKLLMLIGFGLAGLAMILSAGLAAGTQQAGPKTGRYPNIVGPSHEQIDLASLAHGYVGWVATYFTPDDQTTVWHWYAREFAVEPEEGTRSGEPCMKLAAVDSFAGVRRTLTVTLCTARHGTRVSVNQNFQWRLVW
jgi:hypothetical protein